LFPGVAVAVVAAALILALTTTSGRLFLASTGDAAIAQEFKRIGGVPTLAIVVFGADRSEAFAVEAEVESVARDQAPELGPPVRSMLGPTLGRAGAHTGHGTGPPRPVRPRSSLASATLAWAGGRPKGDGWSSRPGGSAG
jgi:hypothetical protein